MGGVSWTLRVSRLPVSGFLGKIGDDIASGWCFGGHVYHHIVVELFSDILIKSHCATLHPLIHEQRYSFPTSKSYGLVSILFAESTTTWSTCFLQIRNIRNMFFLGIGDRGTQVNWEQTFSPHASSMAFSIMHETYAHIFEMPGPHRAPIA